MRGILKDLWDPLRFLRIMTAVVLTLAISTPCYAEDDNTREEPPVLFDAALTLQLYTTLVAYFGPPKKTCKVITNEVTQNSCSTHIEISSEFFYSDYYAILAIDLKSWEGFTDSQIVYDMDAGKKEVVTQYCRHTVQECILEWRLNPIEVD
ncbi:MAG: hypothetical protein H6619_06995 [Deltaproteobacteria bacterium]|nr:hypothetical protein [Deltaproteobacteria bacterium]